MDTSQKPKDNLLNVWIRVHGYAIVHEPDLNITYTVGLALRNQPEIVAVGIDSATSEINIAAVVELMSNGMQLEAAMTIEGANGEQLVLLEANKSKAITLMKVLDVLDIDLQIAPIQLIWPDKNNKYPWEASCEKTLAQAQSQHWALTFAVQGLTS